MRGYASPDPTGGGCRLLSSTSPSTRSPVNRGKSFATQVEGCVLRAPGVALPAFCDSSAQGPGCRDRNRCDHPTDGGDLSPGDNLTSNVPWVNLGAIFAVLYQVALETTYLPARRAARVCSAEPLRFR
jgi:ABC-type lipoprotein release transport system permease subunit